MSAWPITKRPEPRYCSFCGRSEHEVDVLIAGPSAFVCDGCVDQCAELVAAKKRARLAGRVTCARDERAQREDAERPSPEGASPVGVADASRETAVLNRVGGGRESGGEGAA